MSTIDLGDNPVGSTPTDAQKTQLRSSIGLGSADTVEFGAIVPPAGSTAEINAIADAEVGSVVLNSENNQYVQFTSANEYKYIGSFISGNQYFVDPNNGDDSKGKAGVFPFATINAALKANAADGQTTVSVNCLPAYYTEEDAFNGVVTTATISIKFENGCFWSGFGNTLPLFDNTTANLNVGNISGDLIITDTSISFWKGPMSPNVTTDVVLQGVVAWPTTEHLFEITGGNAKITVKTRADGGANTRYPWFNVSGDSNVTLEGIDIANGGVQTVVSPLVYLSDTAIVKINNTRALGHGLCEITTDTSCKVIISNCVSCGTDHPPFLPQTERSIAAPAGSSNPKAFAIGNNLVSVAASNITVNVDAGSVNVSEATARDILS